MDKPIRIEKHGDMTIKFYTDDSPESPRDWDNLGTMICFHKNYTLGDKNPGFTPESLQEKIEHHGNNIIFLPIYLMDHSGLTISCNADKFRMVDSHGWDWGKIGYIYVEEYKIRYEYDLMDPSKIIHQDILNKVIKQLENEIEIYNQYLQGEVYGYVVEDEAGIQLDSCWGYYGLDDCSKAAHDCAETIEFESVGCGNGI